MHSFLTQLGFALQSVGVKNQVQRIPTAGFAHLMVKFFFSVIHVIGKESTRIKSTSKANCECIMLNKGTKHHLRAMLLICGFMVLSTARACIHDN